MYESYLCGHSKPLDNKNPTEAATKRLPPTLYIYDDTIVTLPPPTHFRGMGPSYVLQLINRMSVGY